jgi:predicted transcriptional regulator
MSKPSDPFDAEIKARVDEKQKRALKRLAKARQLRSSDILREAVREYLEARNSRKEELANA